MRAWIRPLVLGLLCLLPCLGEAATIKRALHATQAEIDVWLTRRSGHAFSADWSGSNRILSRANAFVANPTLGIWPGNQVNIAWHGDDVRDNVGTFGNTYFPCGSPSTPSSGIRTCSDYVRDAAFVYMLYINSGDSALITSAANYLAPVRTFLLNHANNTCSAIGSSGTACGVDFTNTTKWGLTYTQLDKDFEITVWLRKVTYAYSYVRPGLSGADQATIDAWILGAGNYWDRVVGNVIKQNYPNRDSDNYTPNSGNVSTQGVVYFGGPAANSIMGGWESKQTIHAAFVTAAAVVVNNNTLKTSVKKFFKEWLTYAVFSNGTDFNQYRWVQFMTSPKSDPGLGYAYLASVVGHIVSIADHIARDGDTELYTFTTSAGAFGTSGGPKSLAQVVRRMADQERNNVIVYGSRDSTLVNCEIIDANTDGCANSTLGWNNHRIFHDTGAMAQSNMYYNDSVVRTSYQRTPPSSPTGGGYDVFGGAYGHLPGARFMFGNNETTIGHAVYGATGGGGPTCPASSVCLSSGSDDAEENTSTTAMTLNNNVLELGNDVAGTPPALVALRYLNIPIPQAATCNTATTQFTPTATQSTGALTLNITVQNSLAAPTFTSTAADISGRSLTATTPVSWVMTSWTPSTADANSTTPNLCSLLQPLINDVGWDELNNQVVFVYARTSGTAYRAAASVDNGALTPLTVAYTPAQTGSPVLEQTHFRIGLVDVLDNTHWLAAPNTNALVPSPACVRVRMQVRASGGNFGPQVYKAIVAKDGGAFAEMTSNSADDLFLGTDQRFNNQDATVSRLALGGETFIPGAWLLSPATAFPAVDFSDPSRSEWVVNACTKAGLTPGTFFELCMAQQDGTSVTCTLKPRLTVGGAAAYMQ